MKELFKMIAICFGGFVLFLLGGVVCTLYNQKIMMITSYVISGVCFICFLILTAIGIIDSKKRNNSGEKTGETEQKENTEEEKKEKGE